MPGTTASIKNNGERKIRLIGADINHDDTILQMVDQYYQVPRGDDPGYAGAILVPGEPGLFEMYRKMGYREMGGMEGFSCAPAAPIELQQVSMETCYAVLTGWHLQNWYQNNRLCGSCGAKTVHDEKERMLRCPTCGNLIFPRINPAIITAVTDGDRLLLSRYAGRGYTSYALLAGYTEIGETIEQTVHREVFEEVGLRVKNLRYYKSQPWGVDGNILMGFFCDLDGDDTISIDETELSHAGWYDRHNLPAQDDGFSLTREMIRVFSEGKEPR
jgi:NADH pyrophosphatase NudC (nudix superfamily)